MPILYSDWLMSDQADATNALLRERGVLPPGPPAINGADGEGKPARPDLPKIALPGVMQRDIAAFAHDIGAVLCKNGVFLRADVPMVLNKNRLRLQELSARAFRSYVDRYCWLYYLKRSGDEVKEMRSSMQKDIASDTLASFDFLDQQRQIRRLNVVPHPVLRKDGSIVLLEPGYDWEMQILTMPSTIKYDVWPVEEARTWLVNFFRDVPFSERDAQTGLSRSLAVHVAAMLSTFCLGLLPPKALIPMFVYTANRQGSGKSLLCKSALYPTFGTAAALPFGRDEDELRKQLDTEALEGQPYLFFDNVKRKIASAFIDSWLTQPQWKGRRMGSQREFTCDKQSVVFVSSNHAEVDKDTNRRALFVELFLELADINDRRFERVIDDEYLMQDVVRRDILSALWSLVVHWDKSGRPVGTRTIASFERWSALIGGIVYAAGFGDALAPHSVEFGDTDSKDMRALVAQLAQLLGDESSVTVDFDELIDICRRGDLFVSRVDGKEKEGLFELTRSSRIQMGRLLQRESGQLWSIDGIGKIRFGRRGSKNWRSFFVDRVP